MICMHLNSSGANDDDVSTVVGKAGHRIVLKGEILKLIQDRKCLAIADSVNTVAR
jgi:hypothetical protein